MDPAWNRLATFLTGLGLSVGLAGCYIPGGGWTLRTGLDVRQIRKPAAFVEMVDTKWDEWNRISQFNLCEGACPVPMTVESGSVPAPVDGSLTPLQSTPRLNPVEQPATRGVENVPTPPASTPASPPANNEEVPIPPAPGNTAAGGMRNRVRRRREVYDPPGSVSRATLVPASGYGRSRAQYAESDDIQYDRGPVTLDTPQAAWDSYGDAGQDGSNTGSFAPGSNYSPVIRSSAQAMQPARRTPPQGSWVFARP